MSKKKNPSAPSILDWLNSNPEVLDHREEFTEHVPISLTAEEWLTVARVARVREMSIGQVLSLALAPAAICDLQNEHLTGAAEMDEEREAAAA